MDKGIQLGQTRPSNTTAVSIYSPDGGEVANILDIVVCNTTSSGATFSIYHDEDGTTYDEDSALFFSVNLPGNKTVIIEANWWMRDSDGNLAVKSGTADAINFTVNGTVDQGGTS